jgi:hypothetical protein
MDMSKKDILTSLRYTIIAVSIGLSIIASTFLILEIIDKLEQSQKVKIVNKNHPLDDTTPYYIDKNVLWADNHGEVFPADIFYVLVPIDVPADTRAAFDYVEGKKIGKSSVDLDAYLGKAVNVKGQYYYDEPLTMEKVSASASSYIKPQAVIDIQEIKIVE